MTTEREGRTPPRVVDLELQELEALRRELERRAGDAGPLRWNAEPEEVRRAVLKLVLTLVDFVRQLLERQALRRMEHETLTPDEAERVGLALMRLEETIHDLARQFGISPDELNLDLGPLGTLT
ncbi:MAG: gas vesicle protein K [Planctomycetes bacterium]|nr:gas vesicle protein K [Planctomycetota bacterium]